MPALSAQSISHFNELEVIIVAAAVKDPQWAVVHEARFYPNVFLCPLTLLTAL